MSVDPGAAPAGPGIGRTFATLGAGEILARLVAFGATVYLARLLGAGVYGVVAFAGAVQLYAIHLADAGVDTLGVTAVAREPHRARELASSLLLARLGIGLVLALALVAVGLTLMPQPDGAVLAGLALAIPLRGLWGRWVLIGLGRPGAVATSRVLGELLTAILVLLLVRSAGDLGMVAVTQVAGDGLVGLVLLVAIGRLAGPVSATYRRDVAMGVLRDSWVLATNALLALLVFNVDLILLRFFRDSTVLGWYAAAYALVSFLANLGVSFGTSVLPALAKSGGGSDGERGLYQASLAAAAALTLPLAAGGALLAGGLITLVYGRGFAPAAAALAVLLASLPPVWMRLVAQSALVARGRQPDVLRATVVGAVLTVVLDLALIPRFGMIGAASVTVLAEVVRCAMVLRYAAGAGLPAPGLARYWKTVLAAIAMALVVAAARNLPVLAAVGLGAVAYAAALLATGAIRIGPGRRPVLRL